MSRQTSPLDPQTAPPGTIRRAVLLRAAELGYDRPRLERELAGVVSRSVLQRYLGGQADLTGKKLDAVFGLLGLVVRPADG